MYKNYNSKKPNGKGKAKDPKNTYKGKQEDRRNEMGKSVTNDIDWYLHYPDLTLNAGKLSMLYPAGSKQNFLREEGASAVWSVPAVMAVEYVPSYGYSNSLSDPLTRMSRSLFNNMVAKTNRVPSYEYTDLTMYQIAMTNLIQFYYWAARIYLIAGTYDAYNEAWNAQVFKALRIDGPDIIKNRSLLYSYLINFAHRISAFPFPKEFSLFERTAQLVSNIYCDGEGKKAQMYLFNPLGGYKWDYELETGSSLKFINYWIGDDINYDRIVAIGDELVEAIAGSSDIQMMTSDILKVYADTLVTVNPITEHGVIEPKYDIVVATQLANAMFTGSDLGNLDIKQATDGDELEPYVVATPTFDASLRYTYWHQLRPMVNFLVDNPSEGTVLEGTRFMFTSESDETTVYLKSFGSEILVQMRMIVHSSVASTSPYTSYLFGSVALSDDVNAWKLLSALTCFDWHPRVAIFHADSTEYLGHFWDCANYAFLTDQQIELMNKAALANLMLIYG